MATAPNRMLEGLVGLVLLFNKLNRPHRGAFLHVCVQGRCGMR